MPAVSLRLTRAIPILALALTLALAVSGSARAQGPAGRYFPETGHTLDASFAAAFEAYGGLEILGYPISEPFTDPQGGMLVQYTQNARLEHTPAPQGEATVVRLRALGEALGGWQPPQAAGEAGPGCRLFPESGHTVCHAFLAFFDARGGADLFGYPISGVRLEAGRLVQYFQVLRLDWHPEAARGARVRVAPLGEMHFERMGYPTALRRPRLPEDLAAYRVTALRPQAALLRPVTPPGGAQTVVLVVRDQNLLPVGRAAVLLTARLPDGPRTIVMPLSDEQGWSRFPLNLDGVPPGSEVTLEFAVVYGEVQATTRDSFRVWW
jgi:hypothetical protein